MSSRSNTAYQAGVLPIRTWICPRKTYPLASCFSGERDTKMTKATCGRYTLAFKQEAVRLVESGQTMAARIFHSDCGSQYASDDFSIE